MAIALQRPNDARARPSSLLKRDTDYETVFNLRYPIPLYLACARLMKGVDTFVRGFDPKDQTNLRFYVAMYAASLLTKSTAPTPEQIAAIGVSEVPQSLIKEAGLAVYKVYHNLGASDQVAKGAELLGTLKVELERRFPAEVATARASK